MIIFTILAILAIIAAIVAVVLIGTVGGATLLVFGDVIVFVAIMWLIIKLIFGRKK